MGRASFRWTLCVSATLFVQTRIHFQRCVFSCTWTDKSKLRFPQVGHGSTLEVTGSHLIHIYDTSAQHAVQAADVKVGDTLQTTRGFHNARDVQSVKVVHR